MAATVVAIARVAAATEERIVVVGKAMVDKSRD
jgi:hypothetical protein